MSEYKQQVYVAPTSMVMKEGIVPLTATYHRPRTGRLNDIDSAFKDIKTPPKVWRDVYNFHAAFIVLCL